MTEEFDVGEALQSKLNIAMLIDADNAQAKLIDKVLKEVSKYGAVSVRRIYGDWTTSNLKQWKDVLFEYAIQPIQQFAVSTGKNATDMSLVIDAMDLLHTGNFDGFCIVSSDSDFTRLGARIREAGLLMLGVGEDKTPKSFVKICHKFIHTEIISGKSLESDSKETSPPEDGKKAKKKSFPKELQNLLINAYEDLSGSSEWVNLAAIGNFISMSKPDFDSRAYNFKKLSDSIKASGLFEWEQKGLSFLVKLKEESR